MMMGDGMMYDDVLLFGSTDRPFGKLLDEHISTLGPVYTFPLSPSAAARHETLRWMVLQDSVLPGTVALPVLVCCRPHGKS